MTIRISDENAILLQQAYALLETVEVKGHQNHYAVASAMDRIRAVFDACQESLQKAGQAREKKATTQSDETIDKQEG